MPRYLGRNQIAVCQRSGAKCRAADLVRDGRNPALLVLPEWADPPHPQEQPYVPNDVEGKARWPIAPENLTFVPPVLDAVGAFVVPSGGGGADPNYANVSLLLACNGTNGSTLFPDDSLIARTVTAQGTAQVSTAAPKFGTGALDLPGGAASWLSTPMTPSLELSTGSFTVEGWFKAADVLNGADRLIIGCRDQFNFAGFTIGYNGVSQQLTAQLFGGGGAGLNVPATVVPGTWYYFALVKTAVSLTLYFNGVGLTAATSGVLLPFTEELRIGADRFSGLVGSAWKGQLDDIRITKGVARYSSNFSPPTTPFPSSVPAAELTWTDAEFGPDSPVATYDIYRSVDAGATYTLLVSIPAEYTDFGELLTELAYNDLAVVSAQTYFYKLIATSQQGFVTESNADAATIP